MCQKYELKASFQIMTMVSSILCNWVQIQKSNIYIIYLLMLLYYIVFCLLVVGAVPCRSTKYCLCLNSLHNRDRRPTKQISSPTEIDAGTTSDFESIRVHLVRMAIQLICRHPTWRLLYRKTCQLINLILHTAGFQHLQIDRLCILIGLKCHG